MFSKNILSYPKPYRFHRLYPTLLPPVVPFTRVTLWSQSIAETNSSIEFISPLPAGGGEAVCCIPTGQKLREPLEPISPAAIREIWASVSSDS